MERIQVQEIMECLPKGRTKFYYYKDRYALMLLSYCIGNGMTIREIKKSRYKRLIEKPVVQKLLQKSGNSNLTPKEFDAFYPDSYHCYLLTLGKWGSRKSWSRFYNQTSRPGWNLVLQLNFSAQHNTPYNRMIKPGELHPFHNRCHPIAVNGHHTLAWARIDMDLDKDEALIEEIQTDWVRLAIKSRKTVKSYENCAIPKQGYLPPYVRGLGCDVEALSRYIEDVLKEHIRIWEEAMLAAAIWFLKEEIGISTIYYHTFELGYQLKRISGRKPPRSLYTKLPARFCFEKTDRIPTFLMENTNRKTMALVRKRTAGFFSLVV